MQFVKPPQGVDTFEASLDRAWDQPLVRRKWPVRYDSLEPLAMAMDLIIIVVASLLSSVSYHLYEADAHIDPGKSIGTGILVSALLVSLLKIHGMYRPTELLGLRNQIRAVCLACISVFLLLPGTI